MKRSIAAVLAFLALPALADDKVVRAYGYAYDVVNNSYAYTEIDEMHFVGGKWVGGTTTYYTPDGKEFGVKTLDLSGDPFVPVYKLQFRNLGYAEAITENGSNVSMFRRADDQMKKGSFKKEPGMVADAGLANLIDTHYDELLKGGTVKFQIIAPSQLDVYKFKARRVDDDVVDGKARVQIQVDLDSLLKLFAGPLTFVYDPATRRLLEFRGQSEVLNPKTGQPYSVKLLYSATRPKDAPALPP